MRVTAFRSIAVSVIVSSAWLAAAQEPGSDCRVPAAPAHPLADRVGVLSSFERLPDTCLKALFADCSDAAGEQLLDLGSAAICSIGYEALLKRGFGGDFHALMGWWRSQRGGTVAD